MFLSLVRESEKAARKVRFGFVVCLPNDGEFPKPRAHNLPIDGLQSVSKELYDGDIQSDLRQRRHLREETSARLQLEGSGECIPWWVYEYQGLCSFDWEDLKRVQAFRVEGVGTVLIGPGMHHESQMGS